MHFSLPVYTFSDEAHAAYYEVRAQKMARGLTHYLDASALVKLVIAEDHAEKLRAYCGRARLATTSICFGEALGVLKAKWTHRHNARS